MKEWSRKISCRKDSLAEEFATNYPTKASSNAVRSHVEVQKYLMYNKYSNQRLLVVYQKTSNHQRKTIVYMHLIFAKCVTDPKRMYKDRRRRGFGKKVWLQHDEAY